MKRNLNKKTILTVVITLLVGIATGYLLFHTSGNESIDNAQSKRESEEGQTWTCSMHPQIRQPEPGDCPICGMDLIPAESVGREGIDPDAIAMTPTAMKLANVVTTTVGGGEKTKSISLTGKIQADERQVYTQSSHIPGRIENLGVNFTGEYVVKDQALGAIYSPELVTAQQELFEARKIKDSQPALFQAAINRLRNWKLSEAQIEEISVAETAKENFPITADISGYVTEKMVKSGDYVRLGEAIYQIADLSKVWVLFDVYESDLEWIEEGDSLSFTIPSLPGKKYSGAIDFLDPIINPKTRVAQARMSLANENNRLKPEMFVNGKIRTTLSAGEGSLVVPKSAVLWTGKRSVVYVQHTTDKQVSFEMRQVELGPSLGHSYIIEKGLHRGEEIAVNGTFSIDAAAQLAGKPSMMAPSGSVEKSGHDHSNIEMDRENKKQEQQVQRVEVGEQGMAAINGFVITYLELKNALVNDDYSNAREMSRELNEMISETPMKLFDGAAQTVWMQRSKEMSRSLSRMQNADDIGAIRSAFKPMSGALIGLIKSSGYSAKKLFIDYCPMADNNNGASWLSTEEKIKNPYFGSSMMGCGEVKGSIE